jgi:putative aldouronate transport system substrate-binding protein
LKTKVFSFTALCLLILTLVLSGCSNGGNSDGNASPSASASDGSASPSASASSESSPSAAAPVTLSVFSNQDSWQDLATNAFTKELAQKFNINFQWTAVPYDGAPEKRQISLASGDYPDVFLLVPYVDHFSQADLLKYGQQGVLVPLNDLIDQYAPNIKAALDQNPDYKAINTAPDGNIYGLNGNTACFHCSYPNKLWVNTGWMQKLGISTPKSTDDFKKMLEAFKKQDPNGNKKADEIPLSGSTETFGVHVIPYLMNAFAYDDDHTYLNMNNGKVGFSPTSPQWKDGLAYIKSLYDEKLIDPGAFTQNASALSKIGNTNPETLGAGAGMHPAIFVDNKSPSTKDYNSIPPIAGPNGVSYATFSYAGNPGASFVITNKASKEQQIAAIKMLDYLYTFDGQIHSNAGIEGKEWRQAKADEKALDPTKQPKFAPITGNLTSDKPANDMWAQLGQYSDFRDVQVQSTDIYSPGGEGYERRLYDATKTNYDGKQPQQIFPFWAVWIDPSSADQASMMQTNINNYVDQNALQFVTGHKSLEKDWDAYVKGFDGLQLNEYLGIMQKAYDSSTYGKK